MTTKTMDFKVELKALEEDGTFEGYASVFGELDFGNDIVEKGAFTRTLTELKDKKRSLPILWQHNSSDPIGVYTEVSEDEKGLYVKGKLFLGVQKGKEAYELIKGGAVSGLSIGYGTRKYELDEKSGVRSLLDVELYEISLVTFPMLDKARVDAVKSKLEDGELPTLKEFENFLREAGFSKSQSTAIASKGLSHLVRSESVPSAKIVEALKEFSL